MSETELKAGAHYFALTFGAGFVLGTIRAIVLEPRMGREAIFVELPVILGCSWVLSRRTCERYGIPARAGPRLIVGLSAYGMLRVAEALLGMALRGQPFLEGFRIGETAADKAGQGAQLLFGFMPLVQALLSGSKAIKAK